MIHIRKSRNGQFYFTVTASNGKVLCTSETMTRKRNVLKGANSLYKQLTECADSWGDIIKEAVVDHTLKAKAKRR